MSWRFSPGPAGEFSLPDYLAGLRSARSKSNRTGKKSFSSVSGMESSNLSRSGTTLLPSTAGRGKGFWTSSPADSRVRTFRSADGGKVSAPASVQDYGGSLRESLARLGLVLSSPKTPRCFPVADSTKFSRTYPAWGTMLAGVVWELGISAGCTRGTASLFLPTPTKSEAKSTASKRYWGSRHYRGSKVAESLRRSKTDPRYLHPSFAEWVMGWPITWTDLGPLETDKFRKWLRWHSPSFQKG